MACPGADILEARILVAGTSAAQVQLIESTLREAGFPRVTATTEPASILRLHRDNGFDLVVLDLATSAIDGHEAIRGLAAPGVHPVLVLAITSDPDQLQRALHSGARDAMAAPVRSFELLARARNLLEMGHAMRALADRGEELERALLDRAARLREADSRFRALVEQSIAGIYTVQDGLWTYVNPRLCDMLGYEARDLVGRATADFVLEEDLERLQERRRRAHAGEQEALSATYRFRRRNGEVVHLSLDGRLIVREGGHVILGVAQDVTGRVHAEEMLREAEAHYRALVEQSLVGIYIMRDDHILYANRMLRELFGFSFEELAGLDLKQLVAPQDHALLDEVAARRRAGETGTIAVECRVLRKDGGLLYLEVEAKVVELGGRRAILGVVRDITERHQARAQLEGANRRLQYLSERVLAVQEQERRALSAELHDDVGQSLLALQIGLHRLAQDSVRGEPRLLGECVDIVSALQEKIREVSVRLHPPQLAQLGLVDALRALISRQRAVTGLDIRGAFEGPARGELSGAAEIACYRICQEALNNATRHSHARVIEVRTKRERGRFCLSIHDDGAGFDADQRREAANTTGHLGLISMEERARLAGGELDLRTAPGAGTVVLAAFPLDIRRAAAAAGARP